MAARFKIPGAAGALLLCVLAPVAARGDNTVAAQVLFDEGRKAMAAKDFASACPKFGASLHLEFALGTLLNLADCDERLGKVATAWAQFLELAGKAKAAGQTDRYRMGKQRATALARQLSNIEVRVGQAPAAGLEVTMDGSPVASSEIGVPIPTDPGKHEVAAHAPGKRPWSTTVHVEGGPTTLAVSVPELEALPPPPPPAPIAQPEAPPPLPAPKPPEAPRSNTQKVLAVVSLGLGVAGAAAGTYFALQSVSDHNDASRLCPQTTCPPTSDGQHGLQLWRDAQLHGNIANVAFAVAGAATVGAVVLWLTAPSSHAPEVGLGWGTVEARGTW